LSDRRRSPDALGEVRNLPGAVAGEARHPRVAPARAVPDVQDEPEPSDIGLGGKLLIDCKEDRTLRAVLVGMLRESDA
jgi:hypothetical protein